MQIVRQSDAEACRDWEDFVDDIAVECNKSDLRVPCSRAFDDSKLRSEPSTPSRRFPPVWMVGSTTTRVAKSLLLRGVSMWGLKNDPGPVQW